jgi:D-3-phosphoglycerate dehydrogenase
MQVLIADKFEAEGVEGLKQLGCKITQDADLSGESLRAALASNGAEVLIVRSTEVTAPMFESAKALKLVIRAGSGYNTIDIQAAKAKGVRVANCPGTNATAVAELAMGLIVALDRRIADNVADLRKGVWNKKGFSKARGLKGRTLGIVGLGKIGYLIAARAKAFEMNLVYADVVRNEAAEQTLGIRRVELPELLKQSDVVSLHVPADATTKHLMNTERLSLMKPTAFLINCSRGDVIDSAALIKALDAGKLAGAGVDVYENEPDANATQFADILGKHPKVYGTHHIGASTDQAQLAVAEEVVNIVSHYKQSGAVLHCVNP